MFFLLCYISISLFNFLNSFSPFYIFEARVRSLSYYNLFTYSKIIDSYLHKYGLKFVPNFFFFSFFPIFVCFFLLFCCFLFIFSNLCLLLQYFCRFYPIIIFFSQLCCFFVIFSLESLSLSISLSLFLTIIFFHIKK